MLKDKSIAVIMTIYNEKSEWISESIDSCLKAFDFNQNIKSMLFIRVDKEKESLSEDVKILLEKYSKNKFVNITFNPNNIGLPESLNKLFELVPKYDYIARFDADDVIIQDRFQKQIMFLEENIDIDILGCSALLINESSDIVGERIVDIRKELNFSYVNQCIHPSLIMRQEVIKKIQYSNYRAAQDYDFLCRAVKSGFNVVNMSDKLIKYRLRGNSIGAKNRLIQVKYKYMISKFYRKGGLEFNSIEIKNNSINDNIFTYIENKKKNIFFKALSIFSYWHVVNYYLVLRNKLL